MYIEGFGKSYRIVCPKNLHELRAALKLNEAKVILPIFGGTVSLRRQLRIETSDTIVDGRFAHIPLTFRNCTSNNRSTIRIRAANVRLSNIRVRPGPPTEPTRSLDALQISRGSRNVVIDHCSFTWAIDENVDIWHDASDVAFQWNIVAEGLRKPYPQSPPIGLGMLIGDNSRRISVHHNLYAHNHGRNPRIANDGGVVDFVNNVIYNAGDHPITINSRARINLVGNYYKPGNNSIRDYIVTGRGLVFELGNYLEGGGNVVRSDSDIKVVSARFEAPPVTETSAQEAYQQVLSRAGAIYPIRDEIDSRIVQSVIDGTGSIINRPNDVEICFDEPKEFC